MRVLITLVSMNVTFSALVTGSPKGSPTSSCTRRR
jgi:hypothetical protein